jgi:hypothetical protein
VLVAAHRIVIDAVAMAEGAALDVFTREPDRHAVGEDRRHRELFGGGPVDRSLRW